MWASFCHWSLEEPHVGGELQKREFCWGSCECFLLDLQPVLIALKAVGQHYMAVRMAERLCEIRKHHLVTVTIVWGERRLLLLNSK